MKKYFLKISKIKEKKGIALLFTVMLSAILLLVSLSIVDISSKEAIFNTSARNTNDAFFAADTGIECALLNDKDPLSTPFDPANSLTGVTCGGSTITFSASDPTHYYWEFQITDLGDSGLACAIVSFKRNIDPNLATDFTTLISRGYHNATVNGFCVPNVNSVTRELEVIYEN
jgi:hypothetical protein